MENLLFTIGRLRALEGRLMKSEQLHRMVEAPTAEDAFRLLSELSYAQYFDETVAAADFSRVLDAGLMEAKELIHDGGTGFAAMNFLWSSYDLGNLKSAFRLKLQGATSVEDFSLDAGFSRLGGISVEVLNQLVWGGEYAAQSPLEQATQDLQDESNFALIESTLDKAYVASLQALAKKYRSSYLKELVRRKSDRANLGAAVRSLLTFGVPFAADAFLPGGALDFDLLATPTTVQYLVKALAQTRYAKVLKDLPALETVAEQIEYTEGQLETDYQRYLRDAESGEVDTLQVPMGYFERRAHNARLISFIMLAKMGGVSVDQIRKKIAYLSA